MKTALKHQLSRIGLLPHLDTFRRLPEISQWLRRGCTGIAPSPVKRYVIAAYLQRYQLKQFIETGTHIGDTVANVAQDAAIQCTSIELADGYYTAATSRFAAYTNVKLLHGDSGALLPSCVVALHEPALFWLDGHYSGGTTAKGDVETPISAELHAILNSPIKSHVILIDDARCFNGSADYPFIDELLKIVREHSDYRVEVSADIIRLTPKIETT